MTNEDKIVALLQGQDPRDIDPDDALLREAADELNAAYGDVVLSALRQRADEAPDDVRGAVRRFQTLTSEQWARLRALSASQRLAAFAVAHRDRTDITTAIAAAEAGDTGEAKS